MALTNDELKQKLGPDVYEALMVQVATAAAIAQRKGAKNELVLWLKGAAKSWTAWFGAFVIAWPELQPQLQPIAEQMLGRDWATKLTMTAGAIVILLRLKTTQSLKDKAAQPGAKP